MKKDRKRKIQERKRKEEKTERSYLIKIKDNLIEEPDTFDSVIDIFGVEVGKVGNGCK